jgi:hypothetical protein
LFFFLLPFDFLLLPSGSAGLGAWIRNHANQRVLKIALAKEKRSWLDGLFSIARTTAPPYKFANA